jgi:hypothetical protein
MWCDRCEAEYISKQSSSLEMTWRKPAPCPKCGDDTSNGHLFECRPSRFFLSAGYDLDNPIDLGGIRAYESKGEPINMIEYIISFMVGLLVIGMLLLGAWFMIYVPGFSIIIAILGITTLGWLIRTS